MNNIEERAHNYGVKRAGGWYEQGPKGMIYEGSKQEYMKIATEQQKLDIDKAYNWFITEGCKYVYEDSYGDKYVDIAEFNVDFYKEMEE